MMTEKDIFKYYNSTDTCDFNTIGLTKQNQSIAIFYIGEFRNFPFRKNKLPDGWYPRDGKLYDLTSKVGKALNSLDDDFKFDWRIKVTDGKINVPNAFNNDMKGYFERPVDGNDRQVGGLQGDAIRNITGNFYTTNRWSIIPEGVFKFTGNNNNAQMSAGNADDWCKQVGFDLETINYPIADEIRPKNIGMTPAIYLGV